MLSMVHFISFSQITRGKVMEGLTIDSKILGKKVRYTMYLPFDYESSSRYYPVVYLLHGYTDNDTGWLQFGEANMILDEAIASRELAPMILAMPDAGVTWYMNDHAGKEKYEDFFIKEFIPHVESQYRIRAERRYRGIAGLSMGGHGTLLYSLKHPEMFTAAAAFSAAVFTDKGIVNQDQDQFNRLFGKLYGENLKGEARLTAHYKANSPMHIIENSTADSLKGLRLYLDCGDDDFLAEANAEFFLLLKEKKIPHEYRMRDGAHTWTYWRTGLVPALKFIQVGFHQE